MAIPGNLADPWLRIVGGLIDVVIVAVLAGIVDGVTRGNHGIAGLFGLVVTVGYLAFFWNTRGQSVGMMLFGFKVRDASTGQYPHVGPSIIRAFMWWLELIFTCPCLIGFIGWGWQLWDPRHQAVHDKIAGTVVTRS